MRFALTFAALASLLGAACAGETVEQPPPSPVDWHSFQARSVSDAGSSTPTERERAVVDSYATALSSATFAQLAPALAEEAHFAFPGAQEANGRDAVVQAHAALFGGFDRRRVAATRVLRTASVQTLEWTMSGVHSGPWMGIAATHKPVTFKGLTLLWTKDDGAISDVHVYFDVAVVKAQLGAGPRELASLPLPTMPSAGPQAFEQTGSPEETNNVSVARAALDALETKNAAAFIGTKTDDVEVYDLERAEPARGKESQAAQYTAMHRAIGQLDTTVENAWGVAQFAVVEYFVAGEQLAPLAWVPAQRNRVIRLHVVEVTEMREGRIARIWRYDNPSELVTAP